jgi:hypothetical protein
MAGSGRSQDTPTFSERFVQLSGIESIGSGTLLRRTGENATSRRCVPCNSVQGDSAQHAAGRCAEKGMPLALVGRIRRCAGRRQTEYVALCPRAGTMVCGPDGFLGPLATGRMVLSCTTKCDRGVITT